MRREEKKRRRGCKSKESRGMLIFCTWNFVAQRTFHFHRRRSKKGGMGQAFGERKRVWREGQRRRGRGTESREGHERAFPLWKKEKEGRKEEKRGQGRSSTREGNRISPPQEVLEIFPRSLSLSLFNFLYQ